MDLPNDIKQLIFACCDWKQYYELCIDHGMPMRLKLLNDLPSIKDICQEKIEYLRSIPQPDQRTPEWYSFRHNLITASNAYKAFESQSTKNQLIYEKCQPLTNAQSGINFDNELTDDIKMVNVNSTLH